MATTPQSIIICVNTPQTTNVKNACKTELLNGTTLQSLQERI